MRPHNDRAIGDGMDPAAVLISSPWLSSPAGSGFFPTQKVVELALRRWHRIAERLDPDTGLDVPGSPIPPRRR